MQESKQYCVMCDAKEISWDVNNMHYSIRAVLEQLHATHDAHYAAIVEQHKLDVCLDDMMARTCR